MFAADATQAEIGNMARQQLEQHRQQVTADDIQLEAQRKRAKAVELRRKFALRRQQHHEQDQMSQAEAEDTNRYRLEAEAAQRQRQLERREQDQMGQAEAEDTDRYRLEAKSEAEAAQRRRELDAQLQRDQEEDESNRMMMEDTSRHNPIFAQLENVLSPTGERTVLGQGAFGITYLMVQPRTGKQFALKVISLRSIEARLTDQVLNGELTYAEKEEAMRGERLKIMVEINLLEQMKGDNRYGCVKHNLCLLSYDETPTRIRILMPYLEGEDLFEWRFRNFCDERTLRDLKRRIGPQFSQKGSDLFMDIMTQIADGLWELHEHGLVHRDLKPENIRMSAAPCVNVMEQKAAPGEPPFNVYLSLIDFGLSCSVIPGSIGECQSDDGVGSPPYIAPEVWLGGGISLEDWKKVDVFALGVVFYNIIMEMAMFGNGGEGMREMKRLITRNNANIYDADLGTGNRDMDRLIIDMINPDPALRPPVGPSTSTRSVVSRLRRIRNGGAVYFNIFSDIR